jgi:hypothetical protein
MRGKNLQKDRLPKEARLRLLGQDKPLAPGERSVLLRARLPETVAEAVLKLTSEERGKLILAGLGVENAKETR